MGTIEIKSGDGLRADIEPEYGGMVARLELNGTPILKRDDGMLKTAPFWAGGIPILFPFPSKTKDDAYSLNDKTYYMPFHGFVKNACFAVRSQEEDRVVVWIDSSECQRERNYPFEFTLAVEYRTQGNRLHAKATVENRSEQRMPHYLGWHPFFYATDKSRLFFRHSFTAHYDYVNCADRKGYEEIDLSRTLDDVYHTPNENEFTLINEADGYSARFITDQSYRALVVCTTVDNCVCIEPWCGIPDSINQNRFIEWVQPGESKEYHWTLEVSKI